MQRVTVQKLPKKSDDRAGDAKLGSTWRPGKEVRQDIRRTWWPDG